MSWREPFLAWNESVGVQLSDFNRIEGDIDYLAGNGGEQQLGKTDNVEFGDIDVEDITCDSVDSSGPVSGTTGTFSGAVSGTTGTFSGAVSGTTGTFNTVNTGAGANELYPMNQAVRSTDSPTFSNITINGRITPDSTPIASSQSIAALGGYTLPRGFYVVDLPSASLSIRYNAGDGFFTLYDGKSGVVISDGTNAIISNGSVGALTFYYHKY